MSDRQRVLVAAALGAAAALLIILARSGGDLDRMAFGDGAIHRYLATHLTTPPAEVDPAVQEAGSALRYGRIGLPAALWAFGGGTEAGVKIAQPLVMLLAGAAVAAALALLLPRAPLPWTLAAMLAPGFTVSLAGGFAEGVALAAALWGILAALDRRPLLAAGLFSYAILTKETAGAVLLAVMIWRWRDERRGSMLLALGILPPLVWHAIVRARFGHFPLLDPYLTGPRGVDVPGVGLVRSLTDAASAESLAVTIIHLILAAACIALAGRSLFGLAGAVASLAFLSTTPFTPWRWIGDAVRTSIFVEVSFALALLALARPGVARADSIRPRASVPVPPDPRPA